MKTSGIKRPADWASATLPIPHAERFIEDVFRAIGNDPFFFRTDERLEGRGPARRQRARGGRAAWVIGQSVSAEPAQHCGNSLLTVRRRTRTATEFRDDLVGKRNLAGATAGMR